MLPRRILVVVIDGLRASALGAYGNTDFPTPELDRLAADGFVLDGCFARSPELAEVYRDLWYSAGPTTEPPTGVRAASLPRTFADAGYQTVLISDDPEILSLPGADEFTSAVPVLSETAARALEVSDTALAELFAAASDLIATAGAEERVLIWLHGRGMYGPWDAPLELQQPLLAEDDLPPIESRQPPDLAFNAAPHPDLALRYASAYAAQVMVLDDCWQALARTIDATPAPEEWLIILLGARGFPLGEHRRIGGVDARLYAEQLHVPWLIRFPEYQHRLARSGALVTHADVLATLRDCMLDPPQERQIGNYGRSVLPLAESVRACCHEALISASKRGARAVRTPEWSLIQPATERNNVDTAALFADGELYVRPDDRWEVNDVAKLCPDVVDNLAARLAGIQQSGGH